MSTRICVIGNSHLAAVKLGWEEVKDRYPQLSPEMFGSHSQTLLETAFHGGRIVPTTLFTRKNFEWTGGRSVIDLSGYAAFFIVAAGITWLPVFNLYGRFSFLELKGHRPHLISEETYIRAALGLLRAMPAAHLIKLIRLGSSAPIFLCSQAMPSEACLSDPSFQGTHPDIVANGDAAALFALYRKVADILAGEDAIVVHQPETTKSGVALTRQEYSAGSVRLAPSFKHEHEAADHIHMNGRYGAAMIEEMLRRLTS